MPARRSKPVPFVLLGVVALALVGAIVFALVQDDDGNERAGGRQDRQGEAGEPGSQAPVAPEGWPAYTIPDTGYQISHPEGWEISENPPQITFSDPASATSFLIEYTYSPGDDAVAAWEAQAEQFAADHENYNEITIEPTTVEGFTTAAIWEFTYEEDGITFHAVDVGMADEEIGFAHFFQTTEDQWDAEQETFERFRASFGPLQ